MAEELKTGPGRDREPQKNLLRKVINVLNVNRDVQRNDTKKQTETLHEDNSDIINAIAVGNKHLISLMRTGKMADGDKLEEKKERINLFKKIASIPSSIKTNISDKLSNLKEKLTPKNPFSGLLSGVKGMLGGAAKAFIPLLAIGALIGTPLFDGKRFKDNVLALLSIGKEVGLMEFFTGLVFFKAMSMIAKGLLVFSIGAAGVGMTQGVLDRFGQQNWAQGIKDNVLTLLSIGEAAGLMGVVTGALFLPAMTAIAKGLAVFSAGAAVAAGVNKALEYFGQQNWAQTIKDNVLTLLSIGGTNLKELATTLGQTGVFVGTMSGLALGLAAFAVGSGIASFVNPEFGKKIKDNVVTLLSIGEIQNLEGKSAAFKTSMSNLADGLSSFAKGGFVSSLLDAGSAIAGFFTGKDGSSSAFDEILKVADKSAEIDKSAEAIKKLSSSLESLSGLTMPEINLGLSRKTLTEFANLSTLITGLQDGGPQVFATGQGNQTRKINFGKSILDPGLKFEEVRAKVQVASQILDGGQIGRGAPMAASGAMIENTAQNQQAQVASGGGSVVTTLTDASQINNVSNQTNVDTPSPAVDGLDRTR
jgi:hypothetical protein